MILRSVMELFILSLNERCTAVATRVRRITHPSTMRLSIAVGVPSFEKFIEIFGIFVLGNAARGFLSLSRHFRND